MNEHKIHIIYVTNGIFHIPRNFNQSIKTTGRVLGHGQKCVNRQRHALLLHCRQGFSRYLAEDGRQMMSTTMTSEEQRVVKQQILAAFEHGSSVSDLLSTTPVPLHRATVYRLHQRFQTNPETALADGRQGHSSKLRGEVRVWLEAFCRATPECTSCTVQTALSERFGVWVSIAHLNRVRATLGLSRRALGRGKKSASPLL
jgi:transposase